MGPQIWRFGAFELDAALGELRKDGRRLRLEPQPQMLLALFLERPGKLVTRRELKERLWRNEPAYRTDENLNHVVKRLRETLGDSGQNPRFVATVRNRGYRFLADVSTPGTPEPQEPSRKTAPTQTGRPALVVLLLTVGVAAGWLLIRTAPTSRSAGEGTAQPLVRAVLPLEAELVFSSAPSIAISPDGRVVVYAARPKGGETHLYIRELASDEARVVPSSKGARLPFFSPDGERIGFYSRSAARLLQVPTSGGAPTPLGGSGIPFPAHGATWTDAADIVFAPSAMSGLFRITPDGGTEALTTPDRAEREKSHRLPDALPGRNAVLFTIVTFDITSFDEARIAVLDLETGETKILIEGGTSPRYSPSGHIVYSHGGSLYAAPFDIDALEVTSAPRAVQTDVAAAPWSPAQFAVARNGTLVYAPGPPWIRGQELVSVDRRGAPEPLDLGSPSAGGDITNVSLSREGDKLAFVVGGATDHIWVYDIARHATSRVTFAWDNIFPIWSPDGEHIAFWSNRGGHHGIFVKKLGSSRAPELLVATPQKAWPTSWSSDGRRLLFMQRDGRDWDLRQVELGDGDEATVTTWLATPFNEALGVFSPDERWIAYESDISGQLEVYVGSQANPDVIVQVSNRGGEIARWGPNGCEIFYWEGDRFMVADVSDENGQIRVGVPGALFENAVRAKHFDVSPDGQRFIMPATPTPPQKPIELRLVLNWADSLE